MRARIRDKMKTFAKAFRPHVAGDRSLKIVIRLTGIEGPDWIVRVEKKRCQISWGGTPRPDATITSTATAWLQVISGELRPTLALDKGLISVKGSSDVVPRLEEWFDAWRD